MNIGNKGKSIMRGFTHNLDTLKKGVYKDNEENRGKNRVGQKYGGKGEDGKYKYNYSKMTDSDLQQKYAQHKSAWEKSGKDRTDGSEGKHHLTMMRNMHTQLLKRGKLAEHSNAVDSSKDEKTISSTEIKESIDLLLTVAEPQEGKFIGAFEITSDKDLEEYREGCVEDLDDKDSKDKVNKMLDHFVKNTEAKIIDYDDLLTSEQEEEEGEEVFEEEESIPVSKLKDSSVSVPKGYSHFQILPVNYNRGSTNDIAIVFLTEEGNKYYSDKLTGDY